MIAIKHIRTQLHAVLNTKMRGKDMSDRQLLWWDLALEVIGKERVAEDSLGVVSASVPAK